MSRRHLTMLLALGAIWGASFLLIKIALRDLPPTSVIAFRILLGLTTLVLLLPFLPERGRALGDLRARWRALAIVGATNTAFPFFLITWGQQYIDTSIAAIFNASAPLWTAGLAVAFVRSERVAGARLLGILVGFAGIVLLIGFEPTGGDRAVVGSLAVVAAAALYSASALFTARRLADMSTLAISLGVLAWGSLFTLPLGLAQLPGHDLTWEAGAAVLALGAGATGVAYLLYFALIVGAGAARAVLVTYLVPSFALVFGITLLDEALTAQGLAGLGLVLLGVALGTGAVRRLSPATVRASLRTSSLRG